MNVTSRRELLEFFATAGAIATIGPARARAEVVASPGARTALVIGNERYQQNPLSSAANDARGMAALLKEAGFTVDLRVNATRAQMLAGIEALAKSMASPGVTLGAFYYAGHAAQLEWRNYLLPVDGNVETTGDIRAQCVDLAALLGPLGKLRGKTSFVVLDACRDDPFGARVRLREKGLSQYDAPAGSLLAFATAPGRVAVELPGAKNGLYTQHLLRELAVKGVRVEDALKRVRLAVRIASRGAQIPWESTSLESDLYLYPVRKLSAVELEERFKEELALWNRIKNSPALDDWNQYLRQFPNGNFAEIAQARTARLLAERDQPVAVAAAKAAPTDAKKAAPAPQVILGAGRPMPAKFKGSGNPNSAGTYPWRPVWTVGDEFVYQRRDIFSNVVQLTYRTVVKRVDWPNDRVELGDGSLLDLIGSSVKEGAERVFDVPLVLTPAELQVGRHWVTRFGQVGGSAIGRGEYDVRVLGREKVVVPAGEFAAFKIEGRGWFNYSSGARTQLRIVRWVVPGLNLPVRVELHHFGTVRVLVSARQAVLG